ncbi:MAG: hypothetical protein IAG13_31345, partial [Deltaproteobacteria bacterium]|nr:hypothetical protein [Nannocystaceae bacterium]
MALPLVAALHAAHGEREVATTTLIAAERAFVEQAMPLFAAAVARARGQLIGGHEGTTQIEAAEIQLRERGVVRPAAMSSLLTPPVLGW